jgi:hypothetical protein
MINRLIDDINKALDAEAYMAALSLVLTLPDICAKAEYGDSLKNKERYIKWFDEHIGQYEKVLVKSGETEMPYLSGEVVYQLRCSVLHQGNPDIDSSKIKNEACEIDFFTIVVEKKKPFDIYVDAAGVASTMNPRRSKPVRSYRVNVRRLCLIITSVAKEYYEGNKDKFTFFSYDILDWDEVTERMNRLKGGNQLE